MLAMDTYSTVNGNERLGEEFPANNGVQSRIIRNGLSSQTSLVLDSQRGELVEANVKLRRNGVSVDRNAALTNHVEAERNRRRRINGHLDTLRTLIPGAVKMDKASLLTEVISHLKELKKNVAEDNEGFLIPEDIDEVSAEPQEDESDGFPYSVRASLCCNYKPGLLSDLREALDTLHLLIVKAEIATLGSRMKNVFLVAGYKEKSTEDVDVAIHQSLVKSVHQALKSTVDKYLSSEEDAWESQVSNKRRRISLFSSSLSSSSSSGYLW